MRSKLRKRSPGQSIVLIALILAVLVGLVALSVDVGSAYAQQRAAQRASDSASLDAMLTAISVGPSTVNGSKQVFNQIVRSVESHGIKVAGIEYPHAADITAFNENAPAKPGERRLIARYMLTDGATSLPIVGTGSSDRVPEDLQYISITLEGIEQTNFAGVVGRGTLPVVAEGYARKEICDPFPLGIRVDAFSDSYLPAAPWDFSSNSYINFSDGYGGKLYPDPGKNIRRLFLRDDPSPGKVDLDADEEALTPPKSNSQFAWFRWNSDTTYGTDPGDAMANAFKDPTLVLKSFQEAPRPNNNFPAIPNPYPTLPGSIGQYDVVYGTQDMDMGPAYGTGITLPDTSVQRNPNGNSAADSEVAAQLKLLIDTKTIVNLPQYHPTYLATGIRSGGRFRIEGFSSYIFTGYGFVNRQGNNSPASPRGEGWFIDVVEVGAARMCAKNTAPSNFPGTVTLEGSVKITPQYNTVNTTRPGIDMVIVLDASTSMTWDWEGKGTLSANSLSRNPGAEVGQGMIDKLNEGRAPGDEVKAGDTIDCVSLLSLPFNCQPHDAFGHNSGAYTERRIFQAKKAINDFLSDPNNGFRPGDRAAIVDYRGALTASDPPSVNQDTALGRFTKIYPTGGLTPIISGPDPNSVQSQLMNNAAKNNPIGATGPAADYLTFGASPGALGLTQAGSLFGSNDGREHIIVFLTDGLLNVKLNGVRSVDESIGANYDQYGGPPLGVAGGDDLPINQAIRQAQAIREVSNPKQADIYVLAMGSQFNAAGLAQISNDTTNYFKVANNGEDLNDLLQEALNSTINGLCNPTRESNLSSYDIAARTYEYVNGNYVPLVRDGQPALGQVFIRNGLDAVVGTGIIRADGTWKVTGLMPNTAYRVSFNPEPIGSYGNNVFIQSHPSESPTVYRRYSLIANTGLEEFPRLIDKTGFGAVDKIDQPIELELTDPVCVPT